jgi:TPR repeat protein
LGIVIREYSTAAEADDAKTKLISRSIAANNYKVYYSNTKTTSFSVDTPPFALSLENAPPEIQQSLLPLKLKAAIQLYDAGDYENAFQFFNKIAGKGFAPAYYWLGKVYYEGKGVPQNYSKASEWILKGEKAKDPNAIYLSGLLLYEGKSVKSDQVKGLQKIKEAVKYNQTDASIFLLNNTENGLLLKKALDHQKVLEHDLAFPLVYKAAMNKFEMAYLYLGMMHALGEGVEPDETKAFYWFSESAKWGHSVGKYFLGISYLEGIGVPINEEMGIQWLKQSHDMGLEGAATKLEALGALEKK